MFKRVWIVLPMLIIMQLHGMKDNDPMEIETAMVTTKYAPNFFSKLPIEIWNLIACYLIFNDIETEEEFIERTKRMSTVRIGKEVPQELIRAYQTSENSLMWDNMMNSMTYRPRTNKIALLQSLKGQSALRIIAVDTQKELYRIPFNAGEGCHYYTATPDADMFAILHLEYDDEAMRRSCTEVMRYKDILTVTIQEQQQQFVVPGCFSLPNFFDYPSAIAFNKQKTHVIAHCIDHRQFHGSADEASKNPIMNHLILPLTIAEPKKSPEKKTLQHYFAQKGICKQLK